jgi:hypothetical protein
MSETPRVCYVPHPKLFALRMGTSMIEQIMDEFCYMVGSCMERPDYRDVDVRMIVADLRYNFIPEKELKLIEQIVSMWLTKISDLPVDFQIQSQSESNKYKDRPRNGV